jgi:polysaccharide pyruvyl transferase WcaK-like protein
VERMLRNRAHSIVLSKEYKVEEMWGVIGLCKIVISMLTHPVIACIKQSIPVVSVAYSHKTSGIMKAFDIDKYLLFYTDFEGETLKNIMNELFINDSLIRPMLKKHMNDINVMLAELGKEVFSDVHSILKS